MPRRIAACLCMALLALVAANPSTQPVAEPTSKPAAPKAKPNEVEVAVKELGFTFLVPKAWKSVPQKSERVHVFQLPATADAKRATPSLIVLGSKVEAGTEPEKLAESIAAGLREKSVTFDLLESESVVLNGAPAWRLVYGSTIEVTVTTNPGNKKHVEKVPVKVQQFVVVHDTSAVQVILSSDVAGFEVRSKAGLRVAETLYWRAE
jgi:hypothetical protein